MQEAVHDAVLGLLLAVITYVSTNLDNLLLMGSIIAGGAARRSVALGFTLSALLVLGLSASFILISGTVPPAALGWLGLVPLFLGLRLLLVAAGNQQGRPQPTSGALATGLTLLANSTDSVATFGPLLVESERAAIAGIVTGFVLAAATWLLIAIRLADRVSASARLSRISARVGPIIMIAVGIYILLDTTTDTI